MKSFLILIIFLPVCGLAHPGIGIVKDSKGNIYYTDLGRVWKITNGKKSVVIPDVHTHELHIDKNDNLYGENGYYDNKTDKHYHYLWMRRPNGQIDTVVGMKEAYIQHDFSLARDRSGNEYYLKRFLPPHSDTNHIYKKTPDGRETVFATGNFKNVNWLHALENGSLLYVSGNAIYRVDPSGNIQLVKEPIANSKPSFTFSGNNPMVWSVWQDNNRNYYAAVFSDQVVRKIDRNGNMTDVYKSPGNWTPLHGVFDNNNKLWVLEGSDKNEVRATLVNMNRSTTYKSSSNLLA